jgi:hypothetical protein
MRVAFSWTHDGTGVSGFQIFRTPDSTMVTRVSADARNLVVQVASPEPRGYFIRATGGGGTSGPSNMDPGSPHLVRFADDSTGDVTGRHFGGEAFTLHFALPASLPDQCSITDSVILLYRGERERVLVVANDATEVSGHFPNVFENMDSCRVLLVASYTTGGRGFQSTDTTASLFNLAWLTAGDPSVLLPLRTELVGAYPNPFNPDTRIQFSLSLPQDVSIVVYNLAGQKVRTLASGDYPAGEHALTWDGRTDANTPAGTGLYLCRMTTSHTVSTKRLLLLK